MRWLLVNGLNGYMSCKSVQTSWFQIWFNLKKYSSIDWNMPYNWKTELAVIKSEFEWHIYLDWIEIWYEYSILMVWDFIEIS